jgi:hypothetical protein
MRSKGARKAAASGAPATTVVLGLSRKMEAPIAFLLLLWRGFIYSSCFFFEGAFTSGEAAQRAPPPNHRPASRRPRPSAESAPLPQPPAPSRSTESTACRRDPRRRRTQPAPQLLSPPSPPPSPDPLACDLQLASAAVSAARRDSASSHPGRAHNSAYQGGCIEDLPAFAPATPQPPSAVARDVEHLRAPRLPPRGF